MRTATPKRYALESIKGKISQIFLNRIPLPLHVRMGTVRFLLNRDVTGLFVDGKKPQKKNLLSDFPPFFLFCSFQYDFPLSDFLIKIEKLASSPHTSPMPYYRGQQYVIVVKI